MTDRSIYEALTDTIPVHLARALAGEVQRGNMTSAQVLARLSAVGLPDPTPSQLAEFNDLFTKVSNGTITEVHLEDVFFLVEAGAMTIDEAKASLGVT
jgi:hypothetical protein